MRLSEAANEIIECLNPRYWSDELYEAISIKQMMIFDDDDDDDILN